MTTTIKGGVKDFAKLLGTDDATASALIRFFRERGDLKLVEKVKHTSGKGKPSYIYEIPTSLSIVLAVPALVENLGVTHDLTPAVETPPALDRLDAALAAADKVTALVEMPVVAAEAA